MSELHAATALGSFEDPEERTAERNRLAEQYRKVVDGLPGIDFPAVAEGDRSTYKDLTVLIDGEAFGMDAAAVAGPFTPRASRPGGTTRHLSTASGPTGRWSRPTAPCRSPTWSPPACSPRPVDGHDRPAGRRRRPRPGPPIVAASPVSLTGMRFTETKVAGAYLIEPEPIADERGFFARTFCRRSSWPTGSTPTWRRPTLLQPPQGTPAGHALPGAPHQEAKLVRCTPRGDLGRCPRPAAGLADLPGLVRG